MKYLSKLSLIVLALLCIPIFLQAQISGEVLVGTGGNYETLKEFADSLNSQGMSGNTTVSIISDIIETSSVTINQWEEIGGTDFTLSIKPYGGNRTIEGTFTSDALIILNGADRVTIDGEFIEGERNLTLINSATSGTNATIWVKSLGTGEGCNNVTIKNTNIFGAAAAQSVTTTFAIYAGGTSISATGSGADNDNLTIQNNQIKRANFAIFARGTSAGSLDNLLITENKIGSDLENEYITYEGVDVQYVNAPIISENYIFNIKRGAGAVEIAAIIIKENCANAMVTKNLIHSIAQMYYNPSGGYGYSATGIHISTGTGNSNITIANNVITDILTTTYGVKYPIGIKVVQGTGHKILFNSVNLYGTMFLGRTQGALSAAIYIYTSTNLDICNNLFSNSIEGLDGSTSYAIWSDNTSTFTNINNNDYYASGPYGILGIFGSTNAYTIEEWRTLTTQDANSFSSNPQCISNNDLFPIYSSPLLAAGVYIPSITTDILGNERNDPPTIGAYEYSIEGEMTYQSSTVTHFGSAVAVKGYQDQGIILINIIMTGSENPKFVTGFSFNANGTENFSDIEDAKVFFTGSYYTLSTENQFGDTIEDVSSPFIITGNQQLNPGNNYFWLTYSISNDAEEFNLVDAECISITIDSIDYIPDVADTEGAVTIRSRREGEYTVGIGGDYLNLNQAMQDIGQLGLSGDVTLTIVSDITESSPVIISQWEEFGDGGYYLTIKSSAITSYVVQGDFNSSAVIVLNAVSRVIIDGENNEGERNLTIMNNATDGTNSSAAIWIKSLGIGQGCNFITIKNTNIYGANTAETSTKTIGIFIAGVSIATGASGADNDNITIQNNHIQRANYGVYAQGTTANLLENLLIIGNTIGSDIENDYIVFRGIYVKEILVPVIKENYIYNIIRTSNNGMYIAGLEIQSNCHDAQIISNRIHKIKHNSSGGWGAYGINVAGSSNNINFINNTITEVTTINNSATNVIYNPFGIRIASGNSHKIWFNSVNLYGTQAPSGSNGTLSAALLVMNTSINNLDIRNNVFANSLEGLAGSNSCAIVVRGSSASFNQIDNNDYYVSGSFGVLGNIGTTNFNVVNNKTTLLEWQGATLQDTNSLSEDPMFYSNYNLFPNEESPLIEAGEYISEVPFDNLGNTRFDPPTIGAYEFGNEVEMAIVSSNVIHPTFQSILVGDVNQPVICIKIKADGLINPVNITSFYLNSNGTTNPNDILETKLYYTGASNVLSLNNQFGETITDVSSPYFIEGNQELIHGNNYFWLVYSVSEFAADLNLADAECPYYYSGSQLYSPEIYAPTGSRVIRNRAEGTFTVGDGGYYPNLYSAFSDLNYLGLRGDITLEIISNIVEPEPAVLNQLVESGAGGYFVNINTTGNFTIQGNFTNNGVVVLNGTDRLIINGEYDENERNLHISNIANGNNCVIRLVGNSVVTGCNDITIRNCVIEGVNQLEYISHGILLGGSTISSTPEGFGHNNVKIENNWIKNVNYGINAYSNSSSSNNNLQILNNEIGSDEIYGEYIGQIGINLNYCPGSIISNNHIFNISHFSNQRACAIRIINGCENSSIINNNIHKIWNNNYYYGGAVGVDISSDEANNNLLILNNTIYDLITPNYNLFLMSSANPFGIRINGGANHKILFNSINLFGFQNPSDRMSGMMSACILIESSSSGLNIRNNVLSNTLLALGDIVQACIYSTSSISINYNDYYVTGEYGKIGYIGGAWRTTLEEWISATSQDLNSFSENPQFTANDNLMPVEDSPLIGAGLYLENYPFDMLGNPRYNPPTIGAYEYNVVPVVTLISPANNSTDVSLTPLLDWENHPIYYNYTLQIATDENFSNTVIQQAGLYNSSYQIEQYEAFEPSMQYYWRVRANDLEGNTSYWSETWNFNTRFFWQVITETGNYSTIIVQTSINPMLGDRPIANGDAVGLFYQRDEGDWHCGGFSVWNGSNLAIVVWGDNPDTPIKDGFAIGEPYTFKIWDNVTRNELDAIATYQMGNDYYTVSGVSILSSLNAYIITNQDISINSGWNIISSYIVPENDTITNVFENIVTDVKIVKNGAGQMYDPAFGINDIVNWNYADGYLVNMLNEDVLTITGQKLVPENTPINLNNGWNLSAYLRDNEMSPATALESISSSLVLAKNNVGGIYSPVYGINTLGNMQTGQGYYFYMNAASILTYPANSAQKAVAGDEITPLAKYNIPSMKNTGKNATLLISIENHNGNEIGVYNMNNELIGSGAVYNGIAAITMWGDDEATQNIDGAKDNEYLNVKLYNTTNNTSKEISLTQIKEITRNTEESELYYRTNAIYFAKSVSNDESVFGMSIKNIPNPVESNVVFEFSLTDESNAEIQIYTSTGELVASIENGNYSAGLHRISFDASNLASGMYNIVLSSGERRVTSFMIVNK